MASKDPLQGWKIDLKILKHKKQSSGFWLGFWLFESPDGAIAGLLHHILEVGVSKEIGNLAIFLNKENPEILFNFSNLKCWFLHESAVQFGKDGVLFVHRFRDGRHGLGVRLCALDLAAKRFAFVDSIPERFCQVRHRDGKRYSITTMNQNGSDPEVELDLNDLKWRALSNRSNFYPDASIMERLWSKF